MLSEFEKRVVREIQGDLPLESRPFAAMARRLGVTEGQLLDTVENFLERGLLRRFGAALRHQRVGYGGNALVAWVVPPDEIEPVGNAIAAYPDVTHCYQRATVPGWPYNLYSMVHRHSEAECRELVRRIGEALGIEQYILLFSTAELKRSSMQYFRD
ncbi:MAG: Lrp/AsnC family transcriptional regulator [Candidatus Desulforudis sp.]|nr:Lrp/AsnC family transcriptional regulator [Desulforudis sp.]